MVPHSLTAKYRRASLHAALAAGLLTTGLLAAPLAFGLYYGGPDHTRIDLGTLCAIRRALAAGAPLWLSPELGNGGPLLVRPSAQLLYPLRWVLLWLSPDAATSLAAVLHLGIAAAGTVWLARSFRVRPLAAVAAGLAFALSGTGLNLLVHTNYFVAGSATLPLVWAAARRARQRRAGLGPLLGLGLGLSACLLAGAPQSFMIGAALLLLESAPGMRRTGVGRTRALLALFTLPCSLAIAAPLWVGAWLEGQLGVHAAGLSLTDALQWSFGPTSWPAALLPGALFTDPLPHASMWQLLHALGETGYRWNPAPYLGPLFMVALLCGVRARIGRSALVVLVLGLLLALGDTTPLAPLLIRLLPPLQLFRYPEKYLVITTLAATVLASIAFSDVARDARRRRCLKWGSVAMLAGLAAVALSIWLGRGALDEVAAWLRDLPRIMLEPAVSARLLHSVLQAAAPAALALLLLVRGGRLSSLAPLVLVLDLALAGLPTLPLGPGLADLSSPLRVLVSPGSSPPDLLCVDHNVRELSIALPSGDPAWLQRASWRLHLAEELQACDGLSSPVPYAALQPALNARLAGAMRRRSSAAARALGYSNLITTLPPVDGGVDPIPPQALSMTLRSMQAAGLLIYRLRAPIPEVFVARGARLVSGEAEALALLERGADAGAALRVIDDPLARWPARAHLPDGAGVSATRVDRPSTDRATLEVEGRGGAVLGLRTAFLVGWRAQQAGRPLPALRASGQHLAVVVADVAAGPIELRYRPPGFSASVAAASLGAAGLALLAWRGRRRARSVAAHKSRIPEDGEAPPKRGAPTVGNKAAALRRPRSSCRTTDDGRRTTDD